MRFFTPLFIATFILFMGIFLVVVFTAFSRPSGRTGVDVDEVAQARAEAMACHY